MGRQNNKRKNNHNNVGNNNRNNANNNTNQDKNVGATEDKNDNAVERAKYCYDLVNNWIGNADNKVSVSCGIFTGVFGVITFLSGRVNGNMINNEYWHSIYRISFVLSLILMGLSILLYVLAINPNLGKSGEKNQQDQKNKKYPIFYGDIAEIKKEEDYKNLISNAKEKDFLDELLTETHYNSGICMRKMKRYKIGLWLSFASVGFGMLSLVARLLMFH